MTNQQFEVRKILLASGDTLEVEMSPAFVNKLREHYELRVGEQLSDDHVRMYVWGAFKTAIDDAERSMPYLNVQHEDEQH